MKKRILTLTLVLALCLGLAVPAFAAGGFTDVDANAYYAEAVAWAVENGVTNGTSATTFSPDDTCNRAQIATFIWRAKGCPTPEGRYNYKASDLPAGAYYATAVQWLVDSNYRFLADFDDQTYAGRFRPDDPCTRLEAVEFLHAAYPQRGTPSNFSDVTDSQAVDWAASWGVTTGTSETTFSPNETCTRGQIVTFLHRAALLPVIDLTKMTGTYVSERNPQYELIFSFHNPKFSMDIHNSVYDMTPLHSGLTGYGNVASVDQSITVIGMPDGLYLELKNEFAYLDDLFGGKYVLESAS